MKKDRRDEWMTKNRERATFHEERGNKRREKLGHTVYDAVMHGVMASS